MFSWPVWNNSPKDPCIPGDLNPQILCVPFRFHSFLVSLQSLFFFFDYFSLHFPILNSLISFPDIFYIYLRASLLLFLLPFLFPIHFPFPPRISLSILAPSLCPIHCYLLSRLYCLSLCFLRLLCPLPSIPCTAFHSTASYQSTVVCLYEPCDFPCLAPPWLTPCPSEYSLFLLTAEGGTAGQAQTGAATQRAKTG